MAADLLPCALCGAGRPQGSCHIIKLTDEEKAAVRAAGGTPPQESVFCKPCWRALSDPNSGPAVIKGLVQTRLRQLGVGDAEKIAERFHNRLVERIKARPS